MESFDKAFTERIVGRYTRILFGIALATGFLTCAITAAGAGPPPLRPVWGSGDPIWHWPDLFTDQTTARWIRAKGGRGEQGGHEGNGEWGEPGPAIWSGRISAWRPFQIAELSSMTFETGLSGDHWSGFFSGVLLSGEQYREAWCDFRFVKGKPPAVWWIGCGGGGLQAAGRSEPVGWGGNSGISICRGFVEVNGGFSVDRMVQSFDGEGHWSWTWCVGSRLSAPAGLIVDVQIRQTSQNTGSSVVGIRWTPAQATAAPLDRASAGSVPAGSASAGIASGGSASSGIASAGSASSNTTPRLALATAYNLTLGTEIFHFILHLPFVRTGFDLWMHGHPVLGWTPGISFFWGF